MKHTKFIGKRCLAIVLSLVMCFGLLQTTALAARNYVVPVYAVGVDSNNKVVSVMPQGFTAKGNTTTQESTTTSGVQNRTWNWTANGDNTYTMTAYASTNVNAFPYIKWPGDLWNLPSGSTYKGYKTFNSAPYVGQSLGTPNAPGYSWQYGKGNFNIQVTNATGTYLVYYFTVPAPTYNYSLTYDGNGGTVNGQTAYTATSGNTTATSYSFNSLTAVRSGFEFKGWASTQAAANNGTVDVSWPVSLTSSNSSKTVYAVWKELPQEPAATDCITVNKVFSGLTVDDIPEDFSIEYTAVNTKDPQYRTTKTLNLENFVDFNENTMTLTWKAPHYARTGGSTVTISENGDVNGYTYETVASKGTVDNNTHTVSLTYSTLVTTAELTLTNTYTPTTSNNPKLTGITKTRLDFVPVGLPVQNINTDTPVNLEVGESATLLYAITVTGEEGANYTITDPGTTPVDESVMTGTIGSSGTATAYVTKTITINDVVEGYYENTAYIAAGSDTDLGDTTPSALDATSVVGELDGGKTYIDNHDGTIDFTVEVVNKVGATLSSLELTDTMQKISMIMGEDGKPNYTIKLYSKNGEESIPTVSTVTSDGRESFWRIEGPIEQDARIVLTYKGKTDSVTVEGEKWKNTAVPSYTTYETPMTYSDFEFAGTAGENRVFSGVTSCEGVIEK